MACCVPRRLQCKQGGAGRPSPPVHLCSSGDLGPLKSKGSAQPRAAFKVCGGSEGCYWATLVLGVQEAGRPGTLFPEDAECLS